MEHHNSLILPPPAGWVGSESSSNGPFTIASAWQPLHSFNPATWSESKAVELLLAVIAGLPCGECRKHATDYITKNEMDFSTREFYHAYLWRFHNAVNLRIGKPLLGFLDAMSELDRGSDGFVELLQPIILQPIDDPVASRALITVAPDTKSQAELAITGDRMRAYARNHGLDFVAITQLSKQRYLAANKYAYADIAKRYEQSLWLDTDVVVDPKAPSIFDEVPIGSWGMVDDLVFMEDTSWFRLEWRNMQIAWGVPLTPVPKAWNSGVVVAPQDAARCYYPSPMRVPNVWCAEQHWHTQCILANEVPIVDLPIEWNNGYPWRHWTKQLSSSWFNHVNGCRPQSLRLELLAHLAAGNTIIPESLVPKGGDAWQPAWAV